MKELKKQKSHLLSEILMSGRPGSNRRHSAWKADALPTELLPQNCKYSFLNSYFQNKFN